MVVANSMMHARQLMLSKNGTLPKSRPFLKWTKAAFIAESVEKVINTNSHFLQTIRSNGIIIAEIFEVRHHVAHRNSNSRQKFQKWVKQQYGQERPITIGYFLLSKNFSKTSNLERYLKSIQVILDDIING